MRISLSLKSHTYKSKKNDTKKKQRRAIDLSHSREKQKKVRRTKEKKTDNQLKTFPKVDKIIDQILSLFNESTLNDLAKKMKFQIRESKLLPLCFLATMLLSYFGNGSISYTIIASNFANWFGIAISSEAISDRLKKNSTVKYLRTLLKEALSIKMQSSGLFNDCTIQFKELKGIKIMDSTFAELHESLAKGFKGYGGGASKSALKLNWIYDLFTQTTAAVDIKPGSFNDRNFTKKLVSHLKPGELGIVDLGYFFLNEFKKIAENGAFFLSRLQKDVFVYLTPESEPLDVYQFLIKGCRNGKIIDQWVYVGKKDLLPVRLIAKKVPKWVTKQRLKKYKATRKAEPSEEYRIWSQYSIFITNLTEEMCSAELVIKLYSLRWQIELLFKTIKSTLDIHVIRGRNENRVLCIIYLKLIAIALAMVVIAYASSICANAGREISVDKCMKWLKNDNNFIYAILCGDLKELLRVLIEQLKLVCKDRRKKNPSALKIIQELLEKDFEDHNNDYFIQKVA